MSVPFPVFINCIWAPSSHSRKHTCGNIGKQYQSSCLSVSLKEWRSSGRGGRWCLKGEKGRMKKVNLQGGLGVLWSFQRLKKVKCCYGSCLLSRGSYKNLRFGPTPSLTLYVLLQILVGIPHHLPGPVPSSRGVWSSSPARLSIYTQHDFPHLPGTAVKSASGLFFR